MKAWKFVFGLAALLLPLGGVAELSKKFGDYEIHYNALVTEDLAPEVARAYGITRSRNAGMLTVAVLKRDASGALQPVAAEVKATVVTLTARLTTLELKEVREGGAIYYIGEYRLSRPETLRFSLQIQPRGEPRRFDLQFQRTFD
ncbi:DUF4426 domain-containing protein [Pelomicrobium sp. G1]|uniref:DUF4426 domain-containing protein n=1 Tax=unclassified Pelomicrobium TaxID=2815318 RepID=UPI0021DC9F8F|nr:MAG: hypothetical protein KatS3mg123_2681 [Burkholderiales bacterium]